MEIRLPELNDKNEIISYIEEHYAHHENNLSASTGLTSLAFEDWVKKVHNNVTIPDKVWGKSCTYLVFDDNKKLIGMLSIRHDLSDELVQKYGHIGYGVRPSERRKGYANKILAYALKECKKLGLNTVILGCYKHNIGSARTILKNGGKLIREVDDIKQINNYYTINLVNQFYKIDILKN